ncbi:hypothetical protein PILCRDRAFT_10592 [Piloderma croceum F 1598]|uniref:Uncharacterized protein n=1 Tax=Piloderma croceum (strain F 1598) TaxID=765440 RepID=A0A0C3BPG3_PILCF|nr:hypothetical protein PILCRDRAFT_10592 [Piloderma croceum F 1598]
MAADLPKLVDTISSSSADNLFGFCSVPNPRRADASICRSAGQTQYRPWFLGLGSFPWCMDLELYNNIGRIVTFNKALKDWVVWDRPRCALKTKPGTFAPVAASGFRKIPNFIPPLCPHAYNNWWTTKECWMDCYRETVSGTERWVFHARSHNCQFKVVIPPLSTSTKYIQDGDDVSDGEVEDILSSSQVTTSQRTSAPTTPTSSQTALSRPSTSASTSSTPVRAVANSPLSPSTGIPAEYRRLDNFEDYKAILRRVDEISEFLSETSGMQDHPAANRDMPPAALFWYHPMSSPAPFTH